MKNRKSIRFLGLCLGLILFATFAGINQAAAKSSYKERKKAAKVKYERKYHQKAYHFKKHQRVYKAKRVIHKKKVKRSWKKRTRRVLKKIFSFREQRNEYRWKRFFRRLIRWVIAKCYRVKAPTVDAVDSPTQHLTQVIEGTKAAKTAVYIKGRSKPIVPMSRATTWRYTCELEEGENRLAFYLKDRRGRRSPSKAVNIILDSQAPVADEHDPVPNTNEPQSLKQPIQVTLTDEGSGIDLTSIKFKIAGVEYGQDCACIQYDYDDLTRVVVYYTPDNFYPEDDNIEVAIDAADLAGNRLPEEAYTIYTGKHLDVTPKMMAMVPGQSVTLQASEGTPPYRWASDGTVQASGIFLKSGTADDTFDFTAPEIGVYMVSVFDAIEDEDAAEIDVINPIVITGTPVGDRLESMGTFTFTAAGGKNEGHVVWSTDNGQIDPHSGAYTAPMVAGNPLAVTIFAYDATYNQDHPTPIGTAYEFFVDPAAIEITNKPDEGYWIDPGASSIEFHVANGSGSYTWSAIGPQGHDVSATLEITLDGGAIFTAPDEGLFAGKYIITVVDGQGLEDSFAIYVPLQLITRNGEGELATQFDAGEEITFEALGVAATASLVISYSEVPTGVLSSNKPTETIETNTFMVEAVAGGQADVTVHELVDVDGLYGNTASVGVSSSGTIRGLVSNINPILIPNPSEDIIIELLDPFTQEPLAVPIATAVELDGTYSISDLPIGETYWIRLTVRDTVHVGIPLYNMHVEEGELVVYQADVTNDFYLPDLMPYDNNFTLIIHLTANGGPWPDGVRYSYSFVGPSYKSGSFLTANPIMVSGMEAGTYDLYIFPEGSSWYYLGDDFVVDESISNQYHEIDHAVDMLITP
jgi:hypothetical protein